MNGTENGSKISKKLSEYSLLEISHALSSPRGHIVIETSGSTGSAKRVVLSSAAMSASGFAADSALSGPGQWLLTLPTDHIAGVNVLTRSVLAGTTPIVTDRSHSFSQRQFIDGTLALTNSTTYVSLVPTQLHRLLEPGPLYDDSLAALQSYAAVLVGGAATSPQLLHTVKELGVAAVTTYGMSETSGGCIYNEKPLDGVSARIAADGRILLAGAMLADGYLRESEPSHVHDCLSSHELAQSSSFELDGQGKRWHRTNDLGSIDSAGKVTVLGRADDIIISGGLNIVPQAIEAELSDRFGIGQVCVVGIPSPEWGSQVVALVTKGTGKLAPAAQIKAHLRATLGKGHLPRAFLTVDSLPHKSSGKVDRTAARTLATRLANS